MAIPTFGEKWRINLVNASFRGAIFQIESGSRGGGRRTVQFEFPKQDQGFCEDMGRRMRIFRITGYIVQSFQLTDYQAARDTLINALESDAGAGALVHPTLGSFQVMVDTYSCVEHKEKGGFAEFEMSFFEAGQQVGAAPSTTANVTTAAQAALAGLPQSPTMAAAAIAPTVPAIGTGGFGLSGPQAPAAIPVTNPFGSLA